MYTYLHINIGMYVYISTYKYRYTYLHINIGIHVYVCVENIHIHPRTESREILCT